MRTVTAKKNAYNTKLWSTATHCSRS